MENLDKFTLLEWLKKHINKEFGYEWDCKNASIFSLGFDSISSVELISKIEKDFGISIPSDILYRLSETDDFLNEITEINKTQRSSQKECEEENYAKLVNPYLVEKLVKNNISKTFIKASGINLYDSEGIQYLDFLSQYGTVPFGHHPQKIWQAVTELHKDGEPIFSQPSLQPSMGKLAKALLDHAPSNLRYVNFTNSGRESVETACQFALKATGRTVVLSINNHFGTGETDTLPAPVHHENHTLSSTSLTNFPLENCSSISELTDLLKKNPERYACLIINPTQLETKGMVTDNDSLKEVQIICKKNGVIFIADETQTGMGRTGNIFLSNELDIAPDMLLISETLGGGVIPTGAILSSEDIFYKQSSLELSTLFTGNTLATRAGLATLNYLSEDNFKILENIKSQGEFLKRELEKIQRLHPNIIKEVRGHGLILEIKLTSERNLFKNSFFSIAAEQKKLALLITIYLLNVENIRIAPALTQENVLVILPPYTVTRAQCETFIHAVERTIEVVSKGNIGVFFKSIVDKKAYRGPVPSVERENPSSSANTTPSEIDFAFIVHPLNPTSYIEYDQTLNLLSEEEIGYFADSISGIFDSATGSQITLVSDTGKIVRGEFIMISYTAQQLIKMPVRKAIAEIGKAVNKAAKHGAKIVGLGAYTSIVSAGGELLLNENVALTSGNSFTVYSSAEALNLAVSAKNLDWINITACIVGAAGSIGSCLAILIAKKVSKLILIGNPSHDYKTGKIRLTHVVEDIISYALSEESSDNLPHSVCGKIIALSSDGYDASEIVERLLYDDTIIVSSDIKNVALANVVITTTNSPDSLIDHRYFKPESIILDISRPHSVSQEIINERSDLTVIDGGVISLPGEVYLGPYGLEKGTAYACMAETILLALEKRFENVSIGKRLNIKEVLNLGQLSKTHGLRVAGLQSFGKKIKFK